VLDGHVQVAKGAPDLINVLADLDFNFRLEPAAASPPGYQWFNLFVDGGRGQRRCGITAHRLLSALTRLAAGGDLPGFQVIAGERWLEHPAASETAASVTPVLDVDVRRH
jgi:hypothetical protein